mmetsp:Transcript_66907/g.160201  ORF Transcript_66907/g.160201 Transcript_66907/m.160201 type:complete len:333 (+) Transcript_66907:107-1105(+)|eukprot:CAMPEP_0178415372 /NCGR_PEP_ID=MMETSP0689_2-20121128/23517_1 /TAXON_ID=160604 /ORGANISM="Amphidinium massartii, Strain CS-259" /LENGTH=332 /DNA_ID=CAMNT_0020036689 /DNA_START=76 /DNA_END=1074 /DNA_ORIENTATION=+
MCAPGVQKEASDSSDPSPGFCVGIEEKYDVLECVGTGVYGSVYRCRDKSTNEVVAVKTVQVEKQDFEPGIPTHILREISTLQSVKHPNIVKLMGIEMRSLCEFSLVLEYVESDLHKLLKERRKLQRPLPMDLFLTYTLQLLDGIYACHVRRIVHRDLKPQNILIGKDGLKISDFGLARHLRDHPGIYTHNVITLWYRAPELLLGGKYEKYGPSVDMWSAGCVIAEMATSYPLFPGDSEIGTLFEIMKLLGTPTEEMWPGVTKLEHFTTEFPGWAPSHFRVIERKRPELGETGLDLLTRLVNYNPQARLTARRAKEHVLLESQRLSREQCKPQ